MPELRHHQTAAEALPPVPTRPLLEDPGATVKREKSMSPLTLHSHLGSQLAQGEQGPVQAFRLLIRILSERWN